MAGWQKGPRDAAAVVRRHLSSLPPEAAIAVVAVLPVLMTPYLPGLDAPWHALFASVLEHAADTDERYLGGLSVDVRFHGYTGFYLLVSVLGKIMSVVRATQVVVAFYVVGWVFAAASLLDAFGRDRSAAIVVAPAAYSAALSYGFLPFAVAYPLILWQWAAAKRATAVGGPVPFIVLVATTAALGLTHVFAAAVGSGCALLLVLIAGESRHRSKALVALAVPSLLVVQQVAGIGVNEEVPPFMQRVSWWQRIENQPFSSPIETLVELPGNILAFVPGAIAALFVVAALGGLAVALRRSRERPFKREASWLFAIVTLGTFATPFHFDWPRTMVAAQPRLAPLVFAVAVLWLASASLSSRTRGWMMSIAVVAVAATAMPFVRFGAEMRDFEGVIAYAGTGKRTLALIEQPVAPERRPAGPLRHVGAYLVVARGGLVSGFPGWARTQPWVPVALRARMPSAPPPGAPRTFRWKRHGGWDQFLIHDSEPGDRHDYVGAHAALLAERGSWRLYVRRRVGDTPTPAPM